MSPRARMSRRSGIVRPHVMPLWRRTTPGSQAPSPKKGPAQAASRALHNRFSLMWVHCTHEELGYCITSLSGASPRRSPDDMADTRLQ